MKSSTSVSSCSAAVARRRRAARSRLVASPTARLRARRRAISLRTWSVIRRDATWISQPRGFVGHARRAATARPPRAAPPARRPRPRRSRGSAARPRRAPAAPARAKRRGVERRHRRQMVRRYVVRSTEYQVGALPFAKATGDKSRHRFFSANLPLRKRACQAVTQRRFNGLPARPEGRAIGSTARSAHLDLANRATYRVPTPRG